MTSGGCKQSALGASELRISRPSKARTGRYRNEKNIPRSSQPSHNGARDMSIGTLHAVRHSIIVACWHMLTTGELYRDLGGDYYQRRDPERTTKRLIAQLEALGHHVTLETVAA